MRLPGHAHQQGQKLTLIGGDIVCREPGALVVFQYLISTDRRELRP
jgi:hypothetical protein